MGASRVAVVFGTRPELVKLAPLVWELGAEARIIHTGQHSLESLQAIRADLGLAEVDIEDAPASGTPPGHLGHAVTAVIVALLETRPDIVVVQGDTNSTLAGALAASSLNLPLVHVEAGLRAFDRRLPEERNRVVVDHLADLNCAPTDVAHQHLRAEGIPDSRIVVTGNTVVDAALRCLPDARERAKIRRSFGVDRDRYALATFHRQENVDDPARLRVIVDELRALAIPVVFPVHPRTSDRAERDHIELGGGSLVATAPLSYREFLALAADCALMVTDSGGVQEEASIVHRPVVVVRRSTERPEVIGTVASLLAPGADLGVTVDSMLRDLPAVHERLAGLESPFGDGHAAARTIDAIRQLIAGRAPR